MTQTQARVGAINVHEEEFISFTPMQESGDSLHYLALTRDVCLRKSELGSTSIVATAPAPADFSGLAARDKCEIINNHTPTPTVLPMYHMSAVFCACCHPSWS